MRKDTHTQLRLVTDSGDKMKYKIGELVELSAAGLNCDHNYGYKGGFGMIIKHIGAAMFPYKIRWFGCGNFKDFEAKEYELKRYRLKE